MLFPFLKAFMGPQSPAKGHPPLWRRLFHITAGSSIPVLGVFASQEAMIALLAALSGLALVIESVRLAFQPINLILVRWLKPLLKEGEERRITAATYMLLAALGCFLLFDKGIAVAAMLFISVGDPLAALVGSRAPGLRFWGKSPLGSLSLFSAAAGLALVLAATNVASPLWALLAGGAVAAVTELLPLPMDDNATVPLLAGGAMALMTL